FNELVEAELDPRGGFHPAYMIDQSHNVTDPIESMLSSAESIAAAYAKALIVDRAALHDAQESNDVMLACQWLRAGYRTDVSPILARARTAAGGAIDPIASYRMSGYREKKARERRELPPGTGIV